MAKNLIGNLAGIFDYTSCVEFDRADKGSGGLVGKRYPWGDSEPNGRQCNCNYVDKNADAALRQMDKKFTWADTSVDDGYAICAPVGSFPPNGFGLYDTDRRRLLPVGPIRGLIYSWIRFCGKKSAC